MTRDEIMTLINRSLFAEIGYTDAEGRQNIRRVFCVWHKGLGRHLISTNTSSGHVQSLMRDNRACLYFSDDASFEAVCLYGRAEMHFEREYKELLWNAGDEKYYPKGIDDEDYCVLEFIAESGRYYRYDGKGDLVKGEMDAYDTGRTYENGYAGRAEQDTADQPRG
ncbi:MAG: pyridoxamine 5'-phosphate oxidase family protein [Oscillospiraceae bacterium]|jgi:general stress protein 26|nr:pyridoxamine 5'-phosphate oxidase family protein [Oscillospiraceae bacterium]MBQ5337652.1 pyridoxamine 5'-phosphate oxidase family protein [Oscillospiraceae bacterium]MBQ9907672.1 pyridoxamine 5'-phosphate oxidase family protein [Oscillospiraceae bacterium]